MNHPEAERIIAMYLAKLRPTEVISGGAVGVDQSAARLARAARIKVSEYLPAEPNWDRGYKPRNLLIALHCDGLLRISCKESKTYGSGWTRDRVKEMGKPTWEYVI